MLLHLVGNAETRRESQVVRVNTQREGIGPDTGDKHIPGERIEAAGPPRLGSALGQVILIAQPVVQSQLVRDAPSVLTIEEDARFAQTRIQAHSGK